jgi:RecA-family ATPase
MRSAKSEAEGGGNGDEADTSDVREIVFKKSNYGPLGEKITLHWSDGMFLPKPSASTLDRAVLDAKVEETFLTLLRRFSSEGRTVGHKKGPSYAPAVFAAAPEAQTGHISGKMFEAAMERLFAAGTVFTQQYGRPSRPSFQIVAAGSSSYKRKEES